MLVPWGILRRVQDARPAVGERRLTRGRIRGESTREPYCGCRGPPIIFRNANQCAQRLVKLQDEYRFCSKAPGGPVERKEMLLATFLFMATRPRCTSNCTRLGAFQRGEGISPSSQAISGARSRHPGHIPKVPYFPGKPNLLETLLCEVVRQKKSPPVLPDAKTSRARGGARFRPL